MKKALTLVVLIVTPTMAFAQGTVGFINDAAGLVQWSCASDPTLLAVPVGGGHVELLTAPDGTSLTPLGMLGPGYFVPSFATLEGFLAANPNWSAIATTGIGPVAGMFDGGNV